MNVLSLSLDDGDVTAVIVENFDKAVIEFAKRNHIYKDANFEDPFAEKKKKKAVAVGDGTKIRVSEMEETNEPTPTANFASAILAGIQVSHTLSYDIPSHTSPLSFLEIHSYVYLYTSHSTLKLFSFG